MAPSSVDIETEESEGDLTEPETAPKPQISKQKTHLPDGSYRTLYQPQKSTQDSFSHSDGILKRNTLYKSQMSKSRQVLKKQN
jgi:hypothetical protein